MTAAVGSLVSLVDQGVTLPRELAVGLFGSMAAIAAAVVVSAGMRPTSPPRRPRWVGADRNVKNTLYLLFSENFVLDVPTGSTRDLITKAAIETLYRSATFYMSGSILPSVQESRVGKVRELYALLPAGSVHRRQRPRPAPGRHLAAGRGRSDPRGPGSGPGTGPPAGAAMPVLSLAQALGVTWTNWSTSTARSTTHTLVTGEVDFV